MRYSVKKVFLFTGKHLCLRVCFNEETPVHVLSGEIWEILRTPISQDISKWLLLNQVFQKLLSKSIQINFLCPSSPLDTGRKLNVHKTFRRRPGRLLNVLYTLNLRPVSTGTILSILTVYSNISCSSFHRAASFAEHFQ